MDYKIISDGCCDLEKEIIEQYNLRIIPFYISFDEATYYKEIEDRVEDFRPVFFDNKPRIIGNIKFFCAP